jgi:hypothetical protein
LYLFIEIEATAAVVASQTFIAVIEIRARVDELDLIDAQVLNADQSREEGSC